MVVSFEKMQCEHGTVSDRQCHDRPPDLFDLQFKIHGIRFSIRIIRDINSSIHQDEFSGSQQVYCPIHDDPVQPTADGGPSFKLGQMAERLEERLLQDILGVFRPSHDATSCIVQASGVQFISFLELSFQCISVYIAVPWTAHEY